jgi:hypothetical protein
MTVGNDKAKPSGVSLEKSDLLPDAWERFEHAVDAAVKSGPRHRASREKIASLRPVGSPTYGEPVIVFGVVNKGGEWRPFEPYRLLPDGNIEFATLVSAG